MPQPIDINTELARTTAAQRVQEIADRASLAAQQRQAQQVQLEQLEAETVVQQPPESEHESAVTDRRENRERQRRQPERGTGESEEPHRVARDAGDLEIIPDSERHRLDIHA